MGRRKIDSTLRRDKRVQVYLTDSLKRRLDVLRGDRPESAALLDIIVPTLTAVPDPAEGSVVVA